MTALASPGNPWKVAGSNIEATPIRWYINNAMTKWESHTAVLFLTTKQLLQENRPWLII